MLTHSPVNTLFGPFWGPESGPQNGSTPPSHRRPPQPVSACGPQRNILRKKTASSIISKLTTYSNYANISSSCKSTTSPKIHQCLDENNENPGISLLDQKITSSAQKFPMIAGSLHPSGFYEEPRCTHQVWFRHAAIPATHACSEPLPNVY